VSFHGAVLVTLDAKGRLAIPTRFRDALCPPGRAIVVTAHPEGCALIYPAGEWERVRSQVARFPSFNAQAAWWKRLLLGFEEHPVPDGAGRVLLAPSLRQHARLEREAMMVGQDHYYELWDAALWRERLAAVDLAGGGAPPQGMENFSL
jgi:MraZ protein